MKYKICDIEFKTLNDIRKYVRILRDRYDDYEIFKNDDFLFMCELLKRHEHYERKNGCGIVSMYVKTHEVFKKNRGFWLQRKDGSETDFSFEMCLRNKKESKKQRFKAACRVAISREVVSFKRNIFKTKDVVVCPITQETLDYDSCHVDHEPPNTFDEIVESFLTVNNVIIKKVKISGISEDGCTQNKIKDKEIENKFIEFHNKHADLRIVSKKANLSDIKLGLRGKN